MKAIKKITEVILTIIASIALLMMTAEAETIGIHSGPAGQLQTHQEDRSGLIQGGRDMSHKFREPLPEEYDSDEDYQEALSMYEWAESEYVDDYVEMRQMEREFN